MEPAHDLVILSGSERLRFVVQMIEETPVAGCEPPKGGQADLSLSHEGRCTQDQIAAKFIFHESTRSRKNPIRRESFVGKIPFALDKRTSDNSAMAKDELRQRVKARLAQLQLGAVEAAVRVHGLERNFINDLLIGKKESFSQAKLPLVAEALEMTVAELVGTTRPIMNDRRGSKVSLIPLIDSVTAGHLKSPSSQIPIEDVPLLAFADLGRGEFFALRVEGDSMDRYSPEGSVIVVNKADRTLISGKCYIFSVRGQTTFKAWQNGGTPYLAPHSTNPANKPIFFKKKTDIEVIGRVVRSMINL